LRRPIAKLIESDLEHPEEGRVEPSEFDPLFSKEKKIEKRSFKSM